MDDDFPPDAHRSDGCGSLPLFHCGIFDTVFLCAECRGDLIVQMEDPTDVWKFAAFYVKTYIPLLKYACVFVPPFWSNLVLAGTHSKEKCACNKLAYGCVHMCVCLPVDVED